MHFDLGQDPAIQSSVPTPFLCSPFLSCVFPGWASLCPGLHSFLCAPTFASFNSLLDLLINFLFFHHLLLEQATGEPDQNAIGNGTLHISEGKGGVGKPFCRRETWLAAIWLGGYWVLGRRQLKTFRTGKVAERWASGSLNLRK